MNNSLEESRAGVRTEARIRADSSLKPGVGLQDGAGEVLPEWEPLIEPLFLTSSSCTRSIGKKFPQGEQQGRKPPRAISIDELRSVTKFSSKQAGWPVGYRAFRIVKWST